MRSDTIAVRLFAWMTAITCFVVLFQFINWPFYKIIYPIIGFFPADEFVFSFFEIAFLLVFLVGILIIVSYLFKWVIQLFEREKVAYAWSIVGSGLLAILFFYVCFTPYFFTENYLTKIGTERIYDLALVTSETLTADERMKLAKETSTLGEVVLGVREMDNLPLENIEIESIEVIGIERTFNRYTYKAHVEQTSQAVPEQELVLWELDIKPGFFSFLVEGFVRR